MSIGINWGPCQQTVITNGLLGSPKPSLFGLDNLHSNQHTQTRSWPNSTTAKTTNQKPKAVNFCITPLKMQKIKIKSGHLNMNTSSELRLAWESKGVLRMVPEDSAWSTHFSNSISNDAATSCIIVFKWNSKVGRSAGGNNLKFPPFLLPSSSCKTKEEENYQTITFRLPKLRN